MTAMEIHFMSKPAGLRVSSFSSVGSRFRQEDVVGAGAQRRQDDPHGVETVVQVAMALAVRSPGLIRESAGESFAGCTGLPSKDRSHSQLSALRPGTWRKCFKFPVTTVHRRDIACAAMSASY